MRHPLCDALYQVPRYGCRILNAFESWCAQQPVPRTFLDAKWAIVNAHMEQMTEAEVFHAWQRFLALSDRELLAMRNIGRVILRFLRDETSALLALARWSDPDWDVWAETVPERWKPL